MDKVDWLPLDQHMTHAELAHLSKTHNGHDGHCAAPYAYNWKDRLEKITVTEDKPKSTARVDAVK